jgi:hypothetical protein
VRATRNGGKKQLRALCIGGELFLTEHARHVSVFVLPANATVSVSGTFNNLLQAEVYNGRIPLRLLYREIWVTDLDTSGQTPLKMPPRRKRRRRWGLPPRKPVQRKPTINHSISLSTTSLPMERGQSGSDVQEILEGEASASEPLNSRKSAQWKLDLADSSFQPIDVDSASNERTWYGTSNMGAFNIKCSNNAPFLTVSELIEVQKKQSKSRPTRLGGRGRPRNRDFTVEDLVTLAESLPYKSAALQLLKDEAFLSAFRFGAGRLKPLKRCLRGIEEEIENGKKRRKKEMEEASEDELCIGSGSKQSKSLLVEERAKSNQDDSIMEDELGESIDPGPTKKPPLRAASSNSRSPIPTDQQDAKGLQRNLVTGMHRTDFNMMEQTVDELQSHENIVDPESKTDPDSLALKPLASPKQERDLSSFEAEVVIDNVQNPDTTGSKSQGASEPTQGESFAIFVDKCEESKSILRDFSESRQIQLQTELPSQPEYDQDLSQRRRNMDLVLGFSFQAV